MRFYSMLAAVAYVTGTYLDDAPFTIRADDAIEKGGTEIGVYRINCQDVELGRIEVSLMPRQESTYAYDATTHVTA